MGRGCTGIMACKEAGRLEIEGSKGSLKDALKLHLKWIGQLKQYTLCMFRDIHAPR